MRDLPQLVSVIVGLVTLIMIIRKARRSHLRRGVWFPLALITVLTLVYYALVFIDLNVTDIINASNLSAFLRLAVQITILLYVYYMPLTGSNH